MRARLAGILRRAADRLAPNTATHHLSVSTTNAGAVAVYLDGREIERRLIEWRRERGLPGF